MTNKDDVNFVCELCIEPVHDYEPHVRIAADAAMRDDQGKYGSIISNKMMVFAVFHSECLIDTMHRSDCDDVPYIWEGRSLLNGVQLCGTCSSRNHRHGENKTMPRVNRQLTLLKGGLAS